MVIGRTQRFFQTAAIYSTIATCLVLPFSSSLLSLFSILTILFWLLSGKMKLLPAVVRNNPVALLAVILLALFLIGLAYTSADLDHALGVLKKYRELIFIPLLITLLKDNPVGRKNCAYSFIAGCIILMLASYAMYFSLLPAAKYGNSLIYHITHSYFMAILAYWSLHKSIDSYQYRYFWIVVFLLALVNLFYIAPGRTGMAVFLFLMILFLLQRLSLLQQIIGLLLLTLVLSLTFWTSENFSTRSTMALKEIQNYEYGASRTSMGMRFDWWLDSLKLIREKPLFGHGTGAFTHEHDRLIEGTETMPTDNPHSEYLFIAVQLGVVGLALFLLLLFIQLLEARKLKKCDRIFMQGVVVAMAAGCIMNSFLFDSHQGHFWAFLSGVYFSAYPDKQLEL
ncbi:MAG TPA: O-antigen ligase family protein [Desulfopila sp.]|nr:O-antigen ligase family protein [Desulfopila sp.]